LGILSGRAIFESEIFHLLIWRIALFLSGFGEKSFVGKFYAEFVDIVDVTRAKPGRAWVRRSISCGCEWKLAGVNGRGYHRARIPR
jgi:hypothetical protein